MLPSAHAPAAPPPAPADAARGAYARGVGIAFAGVFAPLALQLAFVPVWFEHVGFSAAQIGLLLGVPMVARMVTTPPLLALADGLERTRYFALWAALALLASLGYLVSTAFAVALLVSIVLSSATALAVPLVDAIALSGVRRHGLDYGRVRLWGSVSFVAVTLGAGWLVERAGAAVVPFALVVALLATMLCGLALPRVPIASRPPRVMAGLARDRTLLLGIAAAAAGNAAHGVFYGFSSIHWAGLGFSGTAIGLLWGLGVVAEIALFALAPRVLPRATPLGLVSAGCAVGVVRWSLFTVEGGVAWFAINSVLHGATFGAVLLGLQRLIAARVDDARQGGAQALSHLVLAPAMAAITLASGWLYGAFGAGAFWPMAALCAVGVVLCVLAARQPQSAGSGGDTSEPE